MSHYLWFSQSWSQHENITMQFVVHQANKTRLRARVRSNWKWSTNDIGCLEIPISNISNVWSVMWHLIGQSVSLGTMGVISRCAASLFILTLSLEPAAGERYPPENETYILHEHNLRCPRKRCLTRIWQDYINTGKLILFLWHSCNKYLYFDFKLF